MAQVAPPAHTRPSTFGASIVSESGAPPCSHAAHAHSLSPQASLAHTTVSPASFAHTAVSPAGQDQAPVFDTTVHPSSHCLVNTEAQATFENSPLNSPGNVGSTHDGTVPSTNLAATGSELCDGPGPSLALPGSPLAAGLVSALELDGSPSPPTTGGTQPRTKKIIPYIDEPLAKHLRTCLENLLGSCPLCYLLNDPNAHTIDQCPQNDIGLASSQDHDWKVFKNGITVAKRRSHCWSCFIPQKVRYRPKLCTFTKTTTLTLITLRSLSTSSAK